MANTNPNGDNMTIHPNIVIPTPGVYKAPINEGELAKYQEVNAVIARAIDIQEKTLAMKFFATEADSYPLCVV